MPALFCRGYLNRQRCSTEQEIFANAKIYIALAKAVCYNTFIQVRRDVNGRLI